MTWNRKSKEKVRSRDNLALSQIFFSKFKYGVKKSVCYKLKNMKKGSSLKITISTFVNILDFAIFPMPAE